MIAVLVVCALIIVSSWRQNFLGREKMLTIVVVTVLETDACVVDTGLREPVDSRLRWLLRSVFVKKLLGLVCLIVQNLGWSNRAQNLRVRLFISLLYQGIVAVTSSRRCLAKQLSK